MSAATILRAWLVAVALLGVLPGCRGRATNTPDADDPALVAKTLRAHLKRHPDDDEAWRRLALVEWIHLDGADTAAPIFARLAKAGDPVARVARLIAADARLDHATVQTEGYALIEQASTTAADHEHKPFIDAAAELAARLVGEHQGTRPGDDERFVAFFERLDRGKLTVQVRQPLLSERASIARRKGEPYRELFAEEGCVQTWTVGPVIGHHGLPDLATVKPGPLTADPDAVLAELACVVRIWNPMPAPGVRRMRSVLQIAGNTVELELGAQNESRFWLDGKPLWRTDVTDRFASARARFVVEVTPGDHVLDVATVIPDERAWVLVRAAEPSGKPVRVRADATGVDPTPPKAVRRLQSPWPDPIAPLSWRLDAPLRALLAVEDALADGDPDRAERFAGAIPRDGTFPEGHLYRAYVWQKDESRGRSIAEARQRRELRIALDRAPELEAARVRLYDLQLSRGEDDRVAQAIAKLPKARLRTLEGELLRHRVHQARGNEYQSEQALLRAERLNPDGCRVLMARRQLARARDDVRREDQIDVALRECAGSLKLRAALAERRGRLTDAIALWRQELARVPDDIEALEALARLSALAGDRAAAEDHLRAILRLNPYRVGSHIALADLAASQGDVSSARTHVTAALARISYASPLHEVGETLGIPDELEHWRIDGRAALREYVAQGGSADARYEGAGEALVLDRSAVRVYPDGGLRQIVHLVVHLLSKEALDRYGEMQFPEGAQLLTLHSIKPDGTTLEPELIPGKDGLSLRHLQIGDFVEYEIVIDKPPSGQLPGYVDVSTFRFQSLDVPYHRSELVVIHPADMPLRTDRRNDPPTEARAEITLGGESLVTRTWRADRVPRLGVEPGHRALLEEVPSVHVYTDVPMRDFLLSLGSRIRLAEKTNPELRRKVAELTRGKKTKQGKLQVLWSWVVENVEPAGDLTTPATVTYAARRGNRLTLLRAMLEAAKVPSQLWIARDAYGPRSIAGGHPLVELFDSPMLAVTLASGEPPVMVTTLSNVMPLGYLAPGYRGAPALAIPLVGAKVDTAIVRLPQPPDMLRDRRHWDLVVDLDKAGNGTVQGTIELSGLEAVRWRQALREIDRDRIPEVFQDAELGWLRGATLSDLTIDGETDLAAPLRLSFVAATEGMGVRQGGAVVLRAVPMPVSVGPMYATLPKRTTGLVVPYAPEHSVRIEYKLAGARFTDVPAAAHVTSEWGSFERKVVGGGVGKNTLSLELSSTLATGVVEPKRYGDLARFAREVETVEQAVLRLK